MLGAHDSSAGTSTVPGRITVCVRIAPTGTTGPVPVKAASAHDIHAPGQFVDGA